MEIIKFNKYELLNFVETELYKNSQNIPISKIRAISQAKNPRANDEDILLIIAVIEKNIVGYIGALPEQLDENKKLKIAWNSCWWIEKGQPSKIALKLLFSFFKAYDNNIMMRDLTETTKQIILSLKNFSVAKKLYAKKYFFKLNLSSKINKIFKPIDFLINFSLNISQKIFFYKKNNSIRIKYPDEFTEKDEIFISQHNEKELFKRSVKELNWIVKNPWIEEGREKDEFGKRYFFSTIKKSFSNKIMKILNFKDEVVAIVFLKEINGILEIPYIYFDKKDIEIVGQELLNYIIRQRNEGFLTFNKDLQNWFSSKKTSYFYSKSFRKEFVTHNSLKKHFKENFNFQDGEGDFVFA